MSVAVPALMLPAALIGDRFAPSKPKEKRQRGTLHELALLALRVVGALAILIGVILCHTYLMTIVHQESWFGDGTESKEAIEQELKRLLRR
jgi:hypothetical protein